MEAKKHNSMSVISMLISLALFIIAFLAWNRNKQLFGAAEKNCVDPAAKDALFNGLRTVGGYTFLLWVVPLVLSLISVIVYLSKSARAKKEAEAESLHYGYGYGLGHAQARRPMIVESAAGTYRCEVPKYVRPY